MELIKALGLNWAQLISQLINFAILFWLLKKFALTSLLDSIHARQQEIKDGLNNAQAADEALSQAQAKKEQIISEARGQAQQIINEARSQANLQGQEMLEQAKAQATKIVEDGHQQVNISKNKMLLEVKSELADIVAIGVEKMIDQKVDPKQVSDKYLQAGLKA
ncbi:F0F1 ATP synthase subunit B [bacterium]|nr:F0F1 ATP synthase subunit B [bacterium]MBQ6436461.1 F0F1 ATP synthase subunit B [bacterium]